jgi:hypothetical protein
MGSGMPKAEETGQQAPREVMCGGRTLTCWEGSVLDFSWTGYNLQLPEKGARALES